MQSTQTIQESLKRARALMRELIDQLEAGVPGSHAQTPASLTRILVHIENIQKVADQPSEDPANAVKRLRDFANTLERLDLNGENLAKAQDIRGQLVAELRLAADQLCDQSAGATWSDGGEMAGAS